METVNKKRKERKKNEQAIRDQLKFMDVDKSDTVFKLSTEVNDWVLKLLNEIFIKH